MKVNTRIIAAIGAVLVAIVLALGWFIGVSPLLAKAAEAEAARADVLKQNELLAAKVAEMKKQFDDIDVYEKELQSLNAIIPDGDDRNSFLASLEQCAAIVGGVLSSVNQADATAYLQPAGVDEVIAAPGASLAPKLHRVEIKATITAMSSGSAMSYLHCLQEHQPRIFTLETADLKPNGSFEILGYTYVVTDPAVVQSRLDAGPYPVKDKAEEPAADGAADEAAVEEPTADEATGETAEESD